MAKSILVIDDEIAIRKSFLLALEDTDYQVDTVDSGLKGIEMMGQNHYNLIFLDLKMPGMNGVETLKELRKISKDTPIYIVTAFYGEYFADLKKLPEDGIDFEVLQKPVNSQQILMLVQGILEQPTSF